MREGRKFGRFLRDFRHERMEAILEGAFDQQHQIYYSVFHCSIKLTLIRRFISCSVIFNSRPYSHLPIPPTSTCKPPAFPTIVELGGFGLIKPDLSTTPRLKRGQWVNWVNSPWSPRLLANVIVEITPLFVECLRIFPLKTNRTGLFNLFKALLFCF